jgi:hypothetical protein
MNNPSTSYQCKFLECDWNIVYNLASGLTATPTSHFCTHGNGPFSNVQFLTSHPVALIKSRLDRLQLHPSEMVRHQGAYSVDMSSKESVGSKKVHPEEAHFIGSPECWLQSVGVKSILKHH